MRESWAKKWLVIGMTTPGSVIRETRLFDQHPTVLAVGDLDLLGLPLATDYRQFGFHLAGTGVGALRRFAAEFMHGDHFNLALFAEDQRRHLVGLGQLSFQRPLNIGFAGFAAGGQQQGGEGKEDKAQGGHETLDVGNKNRGATVSSEPGKKNRGQQTASPGDGGGCRNY